MRSPPRAAERVQGDGDLQCPQIILAAAGDLAASRLAGGHEPVDGAADHVHRPGRLRRPFEKLRKDRARSSPGSQHDHRPRPRDPDAAVLAADRDVAGAAPELSDRAPRRRRRRQARACRTRACRSRCRFPPPGPHRSAPGNGRDPLDPLHLEARDEAHRGQGVAAAAGDLGGEPSRDCRGGYLSEVTLAQPGGGLGEERLPPSGRCRSRRRCRARGRSEPCRRRGTAGNRSASRRKPPSPRPRRRRSRCRVSRRPGCWR